MSRVKAKAEPVELAAPGTVVAEGSIRGRAVPWKAPTLGRNGGAVRTRGYVQYKTWQEAVGLVAATQRRLRRPYGGAVRLEVTYYLAPRPGSLPDTSNLTKAFEDALQGVVIRNDTQVVGHCTRRVVSSQEPERVVYRVVAVGDN